MIFSSLRRQVSLKPAPFWSTDQPSRVRARTGIGRRERLRTPTLAPREQPGSQSQARSRTLDLRV